jgi:hypothetical protein
MNIIDIIIAHSIIEDLSTCPLGVTRHTFTEYWTVLHLREVPGAPHHLFAAIQDFITTRQYSWRRCRPLLELQLYLHDEIPETMYREFRRSWYRFRTFSVSNEPLIIGHIEKPAGFPNFEDYNIDSHRVLLDYRNNEFVLDFVDMSWLN